jgi:hypothetical protein
MSGLDPRAMATNLPTLRPVQIRLESLEIGSIFAWR